MKYSDRSKAEVFLHCCLFFWILAILRRKRSVKVGTKVLTLGPSLFHKSQILQKFFKSCVCWLEYLLPLVRILVILDHIGEIRAQKPPKRGYLVDVESVHKNLETFNLKTTNAILMRLTTIMRIHENVNCKALTARNSFFLLNLIASLVKLLNKLDDI